MLLTNATLPWLEASEAGGVGDAGYLARHLLDAAEGLCAAEPTGALRLEAVRRLAAETLGDTLGPPADGAETVTMAVSHVHVSDVTVGDPHVVDPSDE